MVRQPKRPCNHAHRVSSVVILGIVVALFFQCMSALLNPVNHPRGGTKWGLAAYAAAMFSLATICVAIENHTELIAYIDDREFPGTDTLPPGPIGYQGTTYFTVFQVVQACTFILNSSLVDGILASSASNSLFQAPDTCITASYIVATLFML